MLWELLTSKVPYSGTDHVIIAVLVGTLSYLVPDIFGHPSVWSYFGGLGPDGYIGYLFVPLVLPFLGLWWLWSHRPARVASLDDVAAVS